MYKWPNFIVTTKTIKTCLSHQCGAWTHKPLEPNSNQLVDISEWVDLHLRGNFRDCSHAVVLWEGVVVENNPFWQPQLVWLSPVAGERVNLGHVLVCENEVVSRSVHVSGNLRTGKTLDLKSVEPLEADFINIDIYLPHTCMKNPASRALLMLWVLVLVPKEGSEMGSSILFRVSVNSDRMASAVFREEQSRKLSWHHFSALKSETYSEIALWLNSDTPWNSIGKQFLWKNYI